MFYYIIGGSVDPVAAGFALVAFAGMITIIITSMIVKRRSKLELNHEFEIGKLKLYNEDEQAKRNNQRSLEVSLAEMGLKRELEFKRIDSGMIDLQATSASQKSSD